MATLNQSSEINATITYDTAASSSPVTNTTSTYTRDEDLAKKEIAVLGIIFLLAVVGNTVVVAITGHKLRRGKLSRVYFMLMQLSVADLAVAFFNVLPQLIWDVTFVFYGNDLMCRTMAYMQIVVIYASTYVLIVTALDRYAAVCFPLRNMVWSKKHLGGMVAIAWMVSFVFALPQLFIFRLVETEEPGKYNCRAYFPGWTAKLYITTFTALIYIIPTMILIFTYGRICYTVWAAHFKLTTSQRHHQSTPAAGATVVSNGRAATTSTARSQSNHDVDASRRLIMTSQPQSRAHRSSVSQSKIKTIRLTLVVILFYFVCWTPFFICQMWAVWDANAPFEGEWWPRE